MPFAIRFNDYNKSVDPITGFIDIQLSDDSQVSAFYLVLPLVWVELHVEHDVVNIAPGLTSKCTIAFLMVPTPENKSGYRFRICCFTLPSSLVLIENWWQNVLLCMCLQVNSNWKFTTNLLGLMQHLGLAPTLVITMYRKQL